MFNLISGAKDKIIAAGISQFLNSKLAGYGEVKNFTLNSKEKSIYLEVKLEGEANNLTLLILGYELKQERGEYFFCFEQINCSRTWLNKLLKQVIIPKYLPEQKILIPAKYASSLKLI